MNFFYIFQPDSLLSHTGDIALLLLVVYLCYALTEKFLSRFINIDFSSELEKFVFLEGVGLGLLAYLTLMLGLCGLLYKWVFYALIVISLFLAKDSIADLLKLLRTTKIELKIFSKHRLEAVILLLFAAFFCVNLMGALAPPTSWDELWYHLDAPKLYIQHHRIYDISGMAESKLVMTQDMFYLFGMLLKSDILAKLFHFAMGILVSLAIYSFSRNYFSSRISLLASLIFYSVPIVGWESTTAYIELGLTFFEFLAVYAVIKWLISKKENWLLLGSVFAGLALGTKYLAILSCLSIVLVILSSKVISKKEDLLGLLKKLAFFSVVVFLISFIWYLKNFINTGNPVFPYLNNIFRSRSWYPTFASFELGVTKPSSMGKGIFDYLMLPWNLTFLKHPIKEQELGPVFLMFLPLLFLFVSFKRTKINETLKYIMIYSGSLFFFWAVTVAYGRFFIPLLPFLSILTSYSIFLVASYLNKNTSRILIAFALFLIFLNLPFFSPYCLKYSIWPRSKQELQSSLGLISRENYLSNATETASGHGYPGTRLINDNLPLSARVLTFDILPYYLNRDSLDAINYLPKYGCSMAKILFSGSEEDFIEKVMGLKITHVAVNLLGSLNAGNRIENMAAKGYLHLIFSEKGIKIYSVSSGGNNKNLHEDAFDKTAQGYKKVLKADPKSLIAHLNLAGICLQRPDYWNRDYDEAFQEYEKVVKLSPDNIPANLGLGFVIYMKEKTYDWGGDYGKKMAGYAGSVGYFKRVLELDPMNVNALSGITFNYCETGKFASDLEGGLKTIGKLEGDSVFLEPTLTAACTFLFLDKLSKVLGIFLVGLIMVNAFLRRFLKEDDVLLTITIAWIAIILINYFPKLFIPFGRLYISFL